MTDNNSKLRAVLLAALMVLWVFAGTMAFAGGAAAQTEVTNVSGGSPADITQDQTTQEVTGAQINNGTDNFGNDNVKVYYNVTELTENNVDLDSLSVSNFEVTNSDQGDATAGATNVNTNSGVTVVTLTFDNAQGDNNIEYNFTLSQLDSSDASEATGVDYEVAATEGSSSDSSFDGSGGSAPSSNPTSSFSIAAGSGGGDAFFTSGETRWQGQGLLYDRSQIADNHSNFQLRNWDRTANPSDRVGSLVRELSFTDNRTVINTDNLLGDYVVTATENGNRNVTLVNQNGVATGSARPSANASDNAYVEVVEQDLTAEFDDSEVSLGDSTNVSLTSNRNNYDVVITSDNLTQSQLVTIFDSEGASNYAGDDDAAIVTGIQSDDELEANFEESNDIEQGDEFEFSFAAEDTTAEDTGNISVSQPDAGDVSFDEAQYSENRGDIATVSMTSQELSSFNVTVGGDNVNYEATVEVEPNDDGEVVLNINTYKASRTDFTGDDDIFTAEEGEVLNVTQDNVNNNRVLDPALYDLSASNNGQEFDVAVLSLEERSTGEMVIHTAPNAEFNNLNDLEGVLEGIDEGDVTESSEIAIKDPSRDSSMETRGDTIVHRVDVSGIEGAAAASGESTDYAVLNQSSAFSVTVEQTNPTTNEDPIEASLGNGLNAGNTNVVLDTDNDTAYVVVRPDALVDDLDAETGDEFNVSFNVSESYVNEFRRSDNTVDADESATDDFTLIDRTAEFDTVDEEVRVAPTENAEVTGETSIAPGTEITVRARATGESPFLLTNTTTVSEDGTFAATFDFSDVSTGQNFTASIRGQSFADNVETDGVVQETDFAEVAISNQTTDGTTATVDRVYVPDGGFVTIHDGTLLDGATFDSVRGTSDYLDSGEHTDVQVSLDTPYEEDGTVIAMPHQDTNDNEEYDFVTSEGGDDGPYANADGEAVVASASLTVDTSTPTPTATATATPEPSTPTATDEPATDEPTETASEDQPGFGAVIALIALLGAALLAARRNAF